MITTKREGEKTGFSICVGPEDLPNPGIEPGSPALQADALPSEPPGKPNRFVSTNPHSLSLSPCGEILTKFTQWLEGLTWNHRAEQNQELRGR